MDIEATINSLLALGPDMDSVPVLSPAANHRPAVPAVSPFSPLAPSFSFFPNADRPSLSPISRPDFDIYAPIIEPSVLPRVDPALENRRLEKAQQDREYEESLRADQEKARKEAEREKEEQEKRDALSPKGLKLGEAENLSREELRLKRLRALSGADPKENGKGKEKEKEKEKDKAKEEIKPKEAPAQVSSRPVKKNPFDEDVEMTDAFADNEEEKERVDTEDADFELARRLQEEEYSDDVQIIGSSHPTPTARRSLHNSNDALRPVTHNIPIEVLDDNDDPEDFTFIPSREVEPEPEPAQPPSRFSYLQQRVRDIANLVRNGGSLMDERPLDPVAKSDEELARQLQEENDREEQDAAYALQLQREQEEEQQRLTNERVRVLNPLDGSLVGPPFRRFNRPGFDMTNMDPRRRRLLELMLERQALLDSADLNEGDDDSDGPFFDAEPEPQFVFHRPARRVPGAVANIPRGIGSYSYEQLLGLEPVPTPVSKTTLSQLPTFKFDGKNTNDPKCSICLGEFEKGEEVRRLQCLHCFHTACIDKWFESKNKCPVCQSEIK